MSSYYIRIKKYMSGGYVLCMYPVNGDSIKVAIPTVILSYRECLSCPYDIFKSIIMVLRHVEVVNLTLSDIATMWNIYEGLLGSLFITKET